MRRGSVLLMHSRTVHSSLPNRTPDRVRLSLDLRYQSVQAPTGRPEFPSFPLRRRDERDPVAQWAAWQAEWLRTRDRLAGQRLGAFNRWDPAAAICA
jgi:ectoine hydroxylase-related dioxygenase (phytanoyl-CoA dioxygenase family)